MVAIDLGGCFLRDFRDRPGKGGMNPFSRAFSKVEMAGEKSAPCANATSSDCLANGLTARRARFSGATRMCHIPLVVLSRVPVRMMWPSWVTTASSLLK